MRLAQNLDFEKDMSDAIHSLDRYPDIKTKVYKTILDMHD